MKPSRQASGPVVGLDSGEQMSSRVKRVSRKARNVAPSQRAAAKGLRTLVRLTLADDVAQDLETYLWMGSTAASDETGEGKQGIYDEVVDRFLQRHERRPPTAALVKPPTRGWRSFWISTPLVERCKRVAERAEVPIGWVVGYALTSFLRERVTTEWRAFRVEAADRARQLLDSPRSKPLTTRRVR